MKTAVTKKQVPVAPIILRQIFDASIRLLNSVCKVCIAAAPFILIEDQQEIEFWQALGYYGVFLLGFAAICGEFRGRGR